jgi:hypothetical protein
MSLLLLMVVACRQPTIGVRVAFPAQTPYLVTKSIELAIFDATLTDQAANTCRALLTPNAPAPRVAAVELLTFGICEQPPAQELPVGRWLLVARGRGYDDRYTVGGCRVVDVFGDERALSGDEAAFATERAATDVFTVDVTALPTMTTTPPTCAMEDKCTASSC